MFFRMFAWLAEQRDWWLVAVAGGILVLAILVAVSLLHRARAAAARERRQLLAQSEEKLRQQNVVLETALDHMTHGLCMFDADARLVVTNQRYLQMYDLPVDRVRPGATLRELVEMRARTGTFIGDPAAYCREVLASVAARNMTSRTVELPDGRTILLAHQPMEHGGWVATHLDISGSRRAEQAIKKSRAQAERAEREARTAHARLLDAFEVVPEGLVLFDAEDRYVMWNRRYAEIYAKSGELERGMRFEDFLRAGLARGQYPEAESREDAWLAERLARHAETENNQEQQLPNGRWLRIQERRTSDGGSIGVRIDITEFKEREASFRLLFEGNPVPMWVYEQDSLRFLAVNDAAVAHYGYPREWFLAKTLLDIRPAEDHDLVRENARAGRDIYDTGHTWRHLKADGTLIDVVIYRRSLHYEGRAASLVASIDLTGRKRAEDELRSTRAFLDTVIENMPEAILVKDVRDLRYILINRAAEVFFGRKRDEIIGKTARDLFDKDSAEAIMARDRKVVESGEELLYAGRPLHMLDGERLITNRRLIVRGPDGEPQYLLGIVEDITERKRAEARIAHMALHDTLTDLPNRVAFNERFAVTLDHAAATSGRFAVMCIDLDRFKEVNDVFGHAVGDAILCEVARRLKTAADGAFLARLGGDEFTVITTEGGEPEAAERLAERLLAAMADEFRVQGHTVRMGMSVGVAIYPADGADSSTLLANADAALYRAKAEGRGSLRFFEPDMDTRLRERRALQHDMESAIEASELILHYQPQARIDGEVIGFEALVRWQHPSRGMIPPGTFIPLAEETGLIVQIGEWILREACREAASWPHPLQIAINLSPVQFRHGDLAGLVHAVLLETGLSASRLELEITEGVLIGDFSRAVAILRRLKGLGVRIAMDDFGTGYSSLSYLQAFPFDKIKIDQAFISNLERNTQSAAIVRAVIGLGRGLDLPVVAEGVETEDQLAFLTREECNEIQGYLIGRPMPIADYAKLVGRPAAAREAPRKVVRTA